MEEEPKPKQPCKTCGPPTAWNPQQTRRELLKTAAIASIGVATAGSLLVASALPAFADPEDFRLAVANCNAEFADNAANCRLQFSGTDSISQIERIACLSVAFGDQGVCLAQAVADEAERQLNDARFYLVTHRYQLLVGAVFVVGTVVVIVLLWPEIVAAAAAAVAFAEAALEAAILRQAAVATIALLAAALKAAQKALSDAQQGAADQNTSTGIVLG